MPETKPPRTKSDPIAEAKETFLANVRRHEMTVLHDEGLYRHLRFAQPGRNGYWFDVVTWPGCLAFRGDHNDRYIFARQDDMFEFFRRNGNEHGTNPGYWAEKLGPGLAETVKAFSEDLLVEWANDQVEEYATGRYPGLRDEHEEQVADYWRRHDHRSATVRCRADRCSWPSRHRVPQPPPAPAFPDDLRRMVAEAYEDGETRDLDSARTLLGALERAKVCSDTWELPFDTYTPAYLWFCHAIVWAIAAYDRGHTTPATSEPTGPATGLETIQVPSGVL